MTYYNQHAHANIYTHTKKERQEGRKERRKEEGKKEEGRKYLIFLAMFS
jgi:hypothetical protein